MRSWVSMNSGSLCSWLSQPLNFVAQHFMHGILHLLALRPRADHAQCQLGGLQAVAAARIETEVCDQHAGVRAVVLDQVPAAEIGWGENPRPMLKIMFCCSNLPGCSPSGTGSPSAPCAAGRGRRCNRPDWGDQGQQRTVGIALIPVAAAEQVVVDAEIDLRRMVAHRVRATLFGRRAASGRAAASRPYRPRAARRRWEGDSLGGLCSVCRCMPRHGTRGDVTERARSNHLSVPKTTLSREDNPEPSCSGLWGNDQC